MSDSTSSARTAAARLLPSLTFALILLPACAPLVAEGAREKETRREWVERDRRLATDLVRLVRDSGLEDGEDRCPVPDVRGLSDHTHDLGFGVTLRSIDWAGGYSRAHVDVLAFRGDVAEYRMAIESGLSWDRVEGEVRQAWIASGGPPFEVDERGLRSIRQFPEVWGELSRALAAELGEMSPVRVPCRLQRPYAVFMSPFSALDVSVACGDGAIDSYERAFIDVLVDRERLDILRNLLRSSNAEARVMALLGLRALSRRGVAIDATTRGTMERVHELPLKVRYCSGCIGFRLDVGEAVERYEQEAATLPTGRRR